MMFFLFLPDVQQVWLLHIYLHESKAATSNLQFIREMIYFVFVTQMSRWDSGFLRSSFGLKDVVTDYRSDSFMRSFVRC